MLNFLFQLALILTVPSIGNGQNTQKTVEFSCEKEFDELSQDLQELIDDWTQIKSTVYGE